MKKDSPQRHREHRAGAEQSMVFSVQSPRAKHIIGHMRHLCLCGEMTLQFCTFNRIFFARTFGY